MFCSPGSSCSDRGGSGGGHGGGGTFAGGWADVALRHLQAPDWAPLVACVVLTAGLRGLAVWRNWELPAWRV